MQVCASQAAIRSASLVLGLSPRGISGPRTSRRLACSSKAKLMRR
jgi:hypothetical protein